MAGDHRQIEALLYEYARRVDAGDFDGVGSLFDGATFRSETADGIAILTGTTEVSEAMRAMTIVGSDGTPGTNHVVTNVVVDVDGDTATSRAHFSVLQANGGTIETVVAGRYEDRFERDGDGWRFRDRLVITDLVGDVSRHLRSNPF